MITALIAGLIVIFILLIAWNFIQKRLPSGETGAAGNPGGNSSGTGGPGSGANAGAPGGNAQAAPAGQGVPADGSALTGRGGPAARNATAVRVTPVVPGTIENAGGIIGDVLARNQVSIYPTVAG
jgi:hypothetical protein